MSLNCNQILFMRNVLVLALLGTACVSPGVTSSADRPAPEVPTWGILVMAHGGNAAWNDHVSAAVAGVRASYPTALAYGMANPVTLAAGLDSLRASGVENVAVVRMFLSGKSFRRQTEYLLGMDAEPPESFVLMGWQDDEPPRPIPHGLTVRTHDGGLMDAAESAAIVEERAHATSADPTRESVLIFAHGMGRDSEDQEVIEAMQRPASRLTELGFAKVEVATLREDWDGRDSAEESARRFVTEETGAGRDVLVLPFRLSGFGPYAEVLQGLDYRAGQGLLPHPMIGRWVEATALRIACRSGWATAASACTTLAAEAEETPGN